MSFLVGDNFFENGIKNLIIIAVSHLKKYTFTAMNKRILLGLIFLVCVSCNKKVDADDLAKVNGYWEIEKVVFAGGGEKAYTINETFDYFEIKGNKGFKKKVTPQLDGTFIVNDDFENVEIKEEGGKYFVDYSTSYAKWREELCSISDSELVMVNDAKNEYHFKRAGAINLEGNGKKVK